MRLIDLKRTGNELRDQRKLCGFTPTEVAEYLNIDRSVIYRWENGYRLPSVENLYNIAVLYGVDMEELIEVERP